MNSVRNLTLILRTGVSFVACVAGFCVRAADSSAGSAPEMHGVVYGVFDSKSGERTGRLRIERVFAENRLHGFLRVAWSPRVILEGITLELDRTAVWPAAGAQFLAALRSLDSRGGGELRRVRLVFAGSPHGEITAATARFRPDGALELTRAAASLSPLPPSPGQTLCLWLTGPDAGRITAPPLSLPPVAAPPPRLPPTDRPHLEK